jgi:hypothetical protein
VTHHDTPDRRTTPDAARGAAEASSGHPDEDEANPLS